MSHESDLLECVVNELDSRTGSLRRVADETGVAYDTVLRIKNREGDPGYSKVRILADYLGIDPAQIAPKAKKPKHSEQAGG